MTYSLTCTNVKAPIEKGEKVGEMVLYKDGVEVDRIELMSNESIERANILDRLREIAQNWNR